jgi:hypothetical protein
MPSPSRFGVSPFVGLLLAAGLAGATLLRPAIASTQPASPFASFAGKWSGSGQVIGADGNREQIRCRASYEISEKGDALTQTLVCASSSYRVDVSSYVVLDGQNAQGYWSEKTRQVQGNLTGHIVDGLFQGTVVGPAFTAQLSLKAAGGKQIVDIKPQGANVAEVEVELSRES